MLIKLLAEFIGTLFLLMVVVGSGIMAENLAQGNIGLALLCNSLATGAGLFVLIQAFAPFSGAHFNPVVSLLSFFNKALKLHELMAFCLAQCSGAIIGVLLSHFIFGLDLLQISQKERLGLSLMTSEFIATFGLLGIITLANSKFIEKPAITIASYIVSAYWFTSSTSFANPAVTIARTFTNTFCGIAPNSLAYFILAQLLACLVIFLIAKKVTLANK